MGVYRTGGVIGKRIVPSVSQASGIWQLGEVEAAIRDAIWPDPGFFWNNTVLLLLFNGANDSTTFTDSSQNPKTITANGGAKISNVQSKFGGTAGYFDGNADYISTPANSSAFAFGTGDYTVEGWVYVVAFGGTNTYLSIFTTSAGSTNFNFSIAWDGRLAHWDGSTNRFFGSTGTVATGAWYHLAFCRANSVFRAFVNGTQVGSNTTITTNYGNTQTIQFPATQTYAMTGECYLDDIRVTRAARYTQNFTPPTAELQVGA